MASVLCLQAAGAFSVSGSGRPLFEPTPKEGNNLLLTSALIERYTRMILEENHNVSGSESKGG